MNTCDKCIYKGKTQDKGYVSCAIGMKVVKKKGNIFLLLAEVMHVDISQITSGMVESTGRTEDCAWPVRFKPSLIKACNFFS